MFVHAVTTLVVAFAVILLLIARLKVHPFVALISVSILVGVLSDVPLGDVCRLVGEHFGNVVGRIGIAIVMAAIVGQCLLESGAAERITRQFALLLGEKYSSLSIVVSAHVLAIPVFGDTVFFLLVPIARAMSVHWKGSYVLYVTAIAAGTSTHYFVPPTPGPLAIAATLKVDPGIVALVGLLTAMPASFCGWLYCIYINRKLKVRFREAPGLRFEELRKLAERPDSELPSFWVSITPVLFPIVLITMNTFVNAAGRGTAAAHLATFLGDPNLALLLSAAISLCLLAHQKRLSLGELAKPVQVSLSNAGIVILLTAAGGAFGGMLAAAGVGETVRLWAGDSSVSLLLSGFLLSALLKLAQGSGTVAMITVTSIVAPLVQTIELAFHPVYLLMAIAAGSLIGTWMNDSGFWLFQTMTGLNEVETLKTKTAVQIVLGVMAFLVAVLGSRFIPLSGVPVSTT